MSCALWGCAPALPPPTPTLDPAVVIRGQVAGNLMAQMIVNADPNPAIANQPVQITVRIANGAGKPSDGLSVEVRASPSDGSASNVSVSAKPGRDGEYLAAFTPTRSGTWSITATARVGGFSRTSDSSLLVKPAP